LDSSQRSVAISQSPLFYVNGLISDWNEKHPETTDVIFFNIGKQSELTENVIKSISPTNPVLNVNPKQCGQLESREEAFIIITTDMFDAVS
jgi:hypothetical protein